MEGSSPQGEDHEACIEARSLIAEAFAYENASRSAKWRARANAYLSRCPSPERRCGAMLMWSALTTPQAIGSGNTVSFAVGDLDLTLD